jgi:protein-arginine kinase activator protein McsA
LEFERAAELRDRIQELVNGAQTTAQHHPHRKT